MVISQHSGEGKANQYYLRGFNLDHGFDFAQTIAGIPVNMPTHAHAQGYADSNFLIPELVSGVQFRKGPYYAENGDFSSAGSANINYFNVLDRPIVTLTGGSFDYGRFLGAASPKVGAGNLLAAFEWERDNGPWVSPNNKDKYNGVVRYSQGDARNGAVADVPGLLEPLALDRPDSAARRRQRARSTASDSSRRPTAARPSATAASFDWQHSSANDSTRVTGLRAALRRAAVSQLHLLPERPGERRPVRAVREALDDRRQADAPPNDARSAASPRRTRSASTCGTTRSAVRSGSTTRERPSGSRPSAPTRSTRRRSASSARPRSSGAARSRTTFGLRGDVYRWNVDVDNPLNSGKDASGIREPEDLGGVRSVEGTEFYANWGMGFHSNSGLGIVLKVDPITGDPATPSPPFARAKGAEFGVRTVAVRKGCRPPRRSGTSASTPS